MSRIGRLPIAVPSTVDVTIEGRQLTVKGPKGTLSRQLHPDMSVRQEDGSILVSRPTEQKTHKQLHGLTRTLVNNMVVGVTDGYRKGLEITGVGYRATLNGRKLTLNLGYSHPIEIDPPEGISFEVENPTRLAVVGVTDGYRKGLEITGVGYRATLNGRKLTLNLGYSHPIEIDPPEGISFEVENPTRLAVVGIDKELVGQIAATVRSTRKPEPYKGKGVRYAGEHIRRKAGKAGKIGGKK